MRFIKGVVDSEDLPLNVSRELLQENELLNKIRSAVIRRSLDMIGKLAEDKETYAEFWAEFGAVLKEGVAEDFSNRERIAPLLRFASTESDASAPEVDLAAYISRMKPGQDAIYYITAENHQAAANSPHLEIFRKNGIEVLLMSDRVDEWMMGYFNEFEDKPFKSIAKGDIDLGDLVESDDSDEKADDQESTEERDALMEKVAESLGDRVGAVRASQRLTDSASCLVIGEQEMALHLQKLLEQAGQDVPDSRPTLELNPDHKLVKKLEGADGETLENLSLLLFEQAVLSEGGSLEDPAGFVRRVNAMMLGD